MRTLQAGVLAGALVLSGGAAASAVRAQEAPPRPPAPPAPVGPVPAPAPAPPHGRAMLFQGGGGRLGVMVQDLTADEIRTAGADGAGVRIDDVEPESAAARSGVTKGDIVVSFDGERVRSARQLSRLVRETPDGRSVPLVVVRDGARQTLDVTPERADMAWNLSVDGDAIERQVAESLRTARRSLPAFRIDGERFDFDWMSARPSLGVEIDALTPQLADYFGASEGGVLVSSVEKDSAAEKAGLTAGDVIVAIGGAPVRSTRDISRRLRETGDGAVTIDIVRAREARQVTATIERRRPTVRLPL